LDALDSEASLLPECAGSFFWIQLYCEWDKYRGIHTFIHSYIDV
jgi:hypothetical protein